MIYFFLGLVALCLIFAHVLWNFRPARKSWKPKHHPRFPDVREYDLKKAAEKALDLQGKSTPVVGWYGHTYGDSRAQGMKTVRGPFGRWFALHEGDDSHNGKSQGCLAPAENDIEYAAFALCNVASISEGYLALLEAVKNPELVDAVKLRLDNAKLIMSNKELSEIVGQRFSQVIDLGDKIDELKAESDANFKAAESWKAEALRQQELGMQGEEKVQEKLESTVASARDLIRLMKEGKPIPSYDTLEKMFSES